jgi:hypothetical protein
VHGVGRGAVVAVGVAAGVGAVDAFNVATPPGPLLIVGAVGLPAFIVAALGLKAPVGLLGFRVRGPLRAIVFPVVFVTKTPRNTIYLPLYLDGLLAKSTKSTTNWAWELEKTEKAKISRAYLI